MSSDKLPIFNAKELISLLEKMGFQQRPSKATSHRRFIHPDGRRTTVPVHPGQDIGRGLLRKILRDIESSIDDLDKYR